MGYIESHVKANNLYIIDKASDLKAISCKVIYVNEKFQLFYVQNSKSPRASFATIMGLMNSHKEFSNSTRFYDLIKSTKQEDWTIYQTSASFKDKLSIREVELDTAYKCMNNKTSKESTSHLMQLASLRELLIYNWSSVHRFAWDLGEFTMIVYSKEQANLLKSEIKENKGYAEITVKPSNKSPRYYIAVKHPLFAELWSKFSATTFTQT